MKTIYVHQCAECGSDSWKFHMELHATAHPYQWVCDTCGTEMQLVFSDNGTAVSQVSTGRRCNRTLCLFTFANVERLCVIADGIRWDFNTDEDQRYYYEEHTCPTNLLRCEEIFFNGEGDPHGILTLVKEIVVSGPNAVDRGEALEELSGMASEKTQV
jgi:hypothetical protein